MHNDSVYRLLSQYNIKSENHNMIHFAYTEALLVPPVPFYKGLSSTVLLNKDGLFTIQYDIQRYSKVSIERGQTQAKLDFQSALSYIQEHPIHQ